MTALAALYQEGHGRSVIEFLQLSINVLNLTQLTIIMDYSPIL